ncbi:ABC transporter permease [Bradyrhizobium sp. Ec3.3]|uniref:ABC transporter permease n=1 Tax=Bradyrhizobium sp. Ec3.3 TaxID=189753 RepID=UPI0004878410|nr:ABC transporter permease [Bradyrhizobium sp. Ec3.3]
MTRFIIRRLAFTLVTLFILSVMVFLGSQVLPGSVALSILGPEADPRSVELLNHQLGVDRPLLVQWFGWIWHFLHGDMGLSYVHQAPVSPMVMQALGYSLKLAAVALLLVVPLGIVGGVVAALKVNRPLDRIISLGGLSATVLPEFVSGIILILVLGIWLHWLPISAAWPNGADPLTQIYYLVLPSLPLVLVLFGYISRMARAGMIEAVESDYTRTAVLKGLTWGQVVWRHVLRNALLPTVTVVVTQAGYLMGGLVVIETLFRYPGIGSLIFTAATQKDFPILESGVFVVGTIFTMTTFLADLSYSVLNPRIRMGTGQ